MSNTLIHFLCIYKQNSSTQLKTKRCPYQIYCVIIKQGITGFALNYLVTYSVNETEDIISCHLIWICLLSLQRKSCQSQLPTFCTEILTPPISNIKSLTVANTAETLWFENYHVLNAKYVTDEAISLFLKQLLFEYYTPIELRNYFLYVPSQKYCDLVLSNHQQLHMFNSLKKKKSIKAQKVIFYCKLVNSRTSFHRKIEVLPPINCLQKPSTFQRLYRQSIDRATAAITSCFLHLFKFACNSNHDVESVI